MAGRGSRYVQFTALGTLSDGGVIDGQYRPATSVGKPTAEEYQEHYALSPMDQSRRDFLGPRWEKSDTAVRTLRQPEV